MNNKFVKKKIVPKLLEEELDLNLHLHKLSFPSFASLVPSSFPLYHSLEYM
jgi:hypothetical protein